MAAIKALVFDKDGTLFHFSASWDAWALGVLDELCRGSPERRATLAGVAGYDLEARAFGPDSPVIAGTLEEVAALFSPHVPEMSHGQLTTFLDTTAAQAPMAPAVPLGPCLDGFLFRGLVLGVLTNDSEQAARAHLDQAGIVDRFAFVAGYDSGYGAKPQPGGLLAFAKATRLAPEACAMVGDSTHDLLAGRAAGMTTIGVLTGMAGVADLAPFADVVLDDIGQIEGWLDTRT
ncbi:MAG: HAD family hydrolase [Brevirhabdus sp.]